MMRLWLQASSPRFLQRSAYLSEVMMSTLLAWHLQKSVHSRSYTAQSHLCPVGGMLCGPVLSRTP